MANLVQQSISTWVITKSTGAMQLATRGRKPNHAHETSSVALTQLCHPVLLGTQQGGLQCPPRVLVQRLQGRDQHLPKPIGPQVPGAGSLWLAGCTTLGVSQVAMAARYQFTWCRCCKLYPTISMGSLLAVCCRVKNRTRFGLLFGLALRPKVPIPANHAKL